MAPHPQEFEPFHCSERPRDTFAVLCWSPGGPFGPPGHLIKMVLVVLMQFILLVGSGIILMYIIARGMQLSKG